MTLEEAQAEIVRLNDLVTEITNERDTFSQNNVSLSEECEKLRTLNQQYFNRICMQFSEQEKDPEPEEVLSCEDFAKTITI